MREECLYPAVISPMSVRRMASRTVYCGNLPGDIRRSEVEDLFYKFGRIVDIDLKTPTRPPSFAFIEFDHPRDADDAVRGRDGYEFAGERLRVRLHSNILARSLLAESYGS